MTEIPSRNSFRSSKNKNTGSKARAIMKEEHWNLGRTRDENQNVGKPTKDTFCCTHAVMHEKKNKYTKGERTNT